MSTGLFSSLNVHNKQHALKQFIVKIFNNLRFQLNLYKAHLDAHIPLHSCVIFSLREGGRWNAGVKFDLEEIKGVEANGFLNKAIDLV